MLFLLISMVLHCISLLSRVLFPCVMVGFSFALLHIVLVEYLFLLNMLFLALKVGCLCEVRDLAATLLTQRKFNAQKALEQYLL